MRKACLTTFLLALSLAGSARASIATLYANNTFNTGQLLEFGVGPYDAIGDSITLSGGNLANHATVQFFNTGSSAGLFDATLQFFETGSPVGSQIGSDITVTGVSIGALDDVWVDFRFAELTLPTSVVYMISVSNVGTDVSPAIDLFAPPSAGGNTADTAILLQGASYTQESLGAGMGNPNLVLTHVPEPSTWVMLGAGLLAFGLRRRRAKS